MRYKLLKLVFLICPLFLAACFDKQEPGRQMPVTGKTVTTVNGVAIKQAELDILIATRNTAKQPISQDKAIDELIGIELLRQLAITQNIHKNEKISAAMNIKSTQVLATAAIQSYVKDLIISDQDLMIEYNKYTENLSSKQFHLRHILSKTEKEAAANIEALKKGSKFSELAKKRSLDQSNERGGDLGWVTPTNFPEPFHDALRSTKPGEFHPEPLQSNNGWHVLMVVDSKELKPASFDSVRNNLKINITNNRIKSYLAELRSEADIQTFEENTTETTQASPKD